METHISTDKYELTDEERERIIERARRNMPELDRRFEQAMENLRRIAEGRPPRRNS